MTSQTLVKNCSRAGNAQLIAHGGRLDLASRSFPHAPQPWVDLSTGVNPHHYPLPPIAPDAWTRLPDAFSLSNLEATAARVYGAPAEAHVIAGAGTQAFIQLLPRLMSASRVAILDFTFAEHELRWRESGAAVETVSTLDACERADVVVIVNPNNPDGRLESPQRLAEIGRRMNERGGALIVDEAFMDLAPLSNSVAPLMARGMIVLRSFGKAYGLPGLRLGFALCDEQWASRLRAALGPWSVSGPALAVGAVALSDAAWLQDSAAKLAKEAARLDELLHGAGFRPIGGAPLFRLVSHPQASAWFSHFGERGILTRAFRERPDWLRFGIPGRREAWTRLSRALDEGYDRFS